MTDIYHKINSNGTADIIAGNIKIEGILPFLNETPVIPKSIDISENGVSYRIDDGAVMVTFREEGSCMVMSTVLEYCGHVHDIEPIGAAALLGADHIYFQGYGMEGPSGYSEIDATGRSSHGIAGITDGNDSVIMFAADHSSYDTTFSVRDVIGMYSSGKVITTGINLEGTNGDKAVLPEIYFMPADDVTEGMRSAAEIIAGRMHARTSSAAWMKMSPAFHWCSWYYHYENLSQEILDGFLKDLREEPTGFRYIQVDAGYTDHIGDWLDFNHRYPAGLKGAADSIMDAGYSAGIWIAPFMIGDQSVVYREHPDWVIHEEDGSPYVRFRSYTEPKIWGNTDNDYYVLDVTHPGAFSYLRNVFERYKEWGYTLYKTDFLLWGMVDSSKVVRYDNSKTSVMIIRDMLGMIRDAIGDESYLLGSIAPFMPCIGYMDGMRIASDMGAQWTEGAFGPANLLQELPYDNYFNNIFWQNDPDSVILRDFATHMSDRETRSIALLQALSGGIITTSDPVTKIRDDRKELLDLIRPASRVNASFPRLTDGGDEIVITHTLEDWNILYVLNPTDYPIRVSLRLDELFGNKQWFQYRYDWPDGADVDSHESNYYIDILESHDSALLFITEEPLKAQPLSLWHR